MPETPGYIILYIFVTAFMYMRKVDESANITQLYITLYTINTIYTMLYIPRYIKQYYNNIYIIYIIPTVLSARLFCDIFVRLIKFLFFLYSFSWKLLLLHTLRILNMYSFCFHYTPFMSVHLYRRQLGTCTYHSVIGLRRRQTSSTIIIFTKHQPRHDSNSKTCKWFQLYLIQTISLL